MVAGAALLLLITFGAFHFRQEETRTDRLAAKARRVAAAERLRSALTAASEAEKSALLTLTDQDSQTYADQARAASAEAESARGELVDLLRENESQEAKEEKELLEQFSRAFGEFKRLEGELLPLAVKNSNVKAYGLAYGPAAEAVGEMDAGVSRLATKSASLPNAENVMLLALDARTAALRIEALLAPHIAEETDAKMDEIEKVMAEQDRVARSDIDRLAAMPALRADTDLETISSSYARFSEVRVRILALSRENTNVRSVAIALGQKRKVMLLCQGALDALQQAIQAEAVPGMDYGRFGRPPKIP